MIIELKSIGIPLSETIREHVRRRVARAVQPFLFQIREVTIVLGGLQSSSMPVGQHCWVTVVNARTQRELVVHGASSDICVAIRKATRRLRVALDSEMHPLDAWSGDRCPRSSPARVEAGDGVREVAPGSAARMSANRGSRTSGMQRARMTFVFEAQAAREKLES